MRHLNDSMSRQSGLRAVPINRSFRLICARTSSGMLSSTQLASSRSCNDRIEADRVEIDDLACVTAVTQTGCKLFHDGVTERMRIVMRIDRQNVHWPTPRRMDSLVGGPESWRAIQTNRSTRHARLLHFVASHPPFKERDAPSADLERPWRAKPVSRGHTGCRRESPERIRAPNSRATPPGRDGG